MRERGSVKDEGKKRSQVQMMRKRPEDGQIQTRRKREEGLAWVQDDQIQE